MKIFEAKAWDGKGNQGFMVYVLTKNEGIEWLRDIPLSQARELNQMISELTLKDYDDPAEVAIRLLNDPIGIIESVKIVFYKPKEGR